MNATLLATTAICAYLGSAIMIVKPIPIDKLKQTALVSAWLAVIVHAVYISLDAQQSYGFNFSFFSMASLVSLIVAILLLMAMLTIPVKNLGIVVFPMTALMLGLELIFPEKQRSPESHSWEMRLHILSSIVAFSLLNIAAIQAILLVIQNQQLKSHPPKRFLQSMPSLETMETMLFQMIIAGLVFLSVSLASGFLFVEDIFAQHLAHKTIFSITAWLIFSGLLFGRRQYGWRGLTAIKWTLFGFLSLLLAYFGSKLVIELILHR